MLYKIDIYTQFTFKAKNEEEAYKYDMGELEIDYDKLEIDSSYEDTTDLIESASNSFTNFCKKYKDNIKIGTKDKLEPIDENHTYIDLTNYYRGCYSSASYEYVHITIHYCIYIELCDLDKSIIDTELFNQLDDCIDCEYTEV